MWISFSPVALQGGTSLYSERVKDVETSFVADAHRDNGKRFVVRSDEILSAFLELERITYELGLSSLLDDGSDSLSR